MQHHPGSWYLPWGVPLQKMLAVPLHPAAVGYGQPQPTAAAACQVASNQPPPQQPTQPAYQHPQLHPAAAAAAALHHTTAAAAALNHTASLHHTASHHPHHPQTTLHPAAAAAMFTPLSLRTFITPPSHLGHLAAQQPLTPAAAMQQTPPTQQTTNQTQSQLAGMNLNVGVVAMRQTNPGNVLMPVKKDYYRTGKRGKIYIKFCNLKVQSKNLRHIKGKKTLENTPEKENFNPEEDAELIKNSLKHDKLTSEEFDYSWKACAQSRLKDIVESKSTAELLVKWPEYKQPFGYRLIDVDFKTRFKDHPSILDKWDDAFEPLLNIVKDGVSNKPIKTILERLTDKDISKNGKDATLLWALHAYFIPYQRTVLKDAQGKHNIKRYTVADSQKAFLLIAKTCVELEDEIRHLRTQNQNIQPFILAVGQDVLLQQDKDKSKLINAEKRKAEESEQIKDLKKAKLETKALKAKRPGFTDERYHETSYYIENGLRKVYPYYFTFTTFTKGRWVGEKILDVFAREFRAHPAEEYERCIIAGTLTVNYEKVPTDYRLKHNDLLANVVHRHEVPVTSQPITIVHMDDDIVVVNKPASIPVHPCGRYRHNTVVFILAKEYNLKNLRTIHRLDRLTSGLLLFGRSPKKARQMEHQIRNRQVRKQYVCRVEGEFPDGIVECKEPIEVVSYKIGVCKVSPKGKECTTAFQKIGYNGKTSVVLCKPLTGRMHQIRVHLQYLGYPVVNDPLYNHEVFGPNKGKGGDIGGKSDEQLVRDLINIHNAENWLGIDGDSELSLFKPMKGDSDSDSIGGVLGKGGNVLSDDDSESVSREASPCSESPRPVSLGSESPHENNLIHNSSTSTNTTGTNVNNLNNNGSNNCNSNNNNICINNGTNTSSSSSPVVNNTNSSVTTASSTSITSPTKVKVTVATQTGHESPDLTFNPDKMTTDKHCYECKVRYRDPKPQDLVMYLHAWKYKGPGWEYETELPDWARIDWQEPECD